MGFVEVVCDFQLNTRRIEKVGIAYLNSKTENCLKREGLRESEEKLLVEDFFVDPNFLKSLDPKEWKNQDHYAVLGLDKLRYAHR